ncbi:unnamed protein product, partial [Ixodes persulcatus]
MLFPFSDTSYDVRRYGPLDSFSSFPFENYLGQLKRLLRTGSRPLAKLYKRMMEQMRCKELPALDKHSNKLGPIHDEGPVPLGKEGAQQYQKLVYALGQLTRKEGNNCVMLMDGSVLIIENIIGQDDRVCVVGRKFECLMDLYAYPCKSSNIAVHKVSNLSS